MRTRPDLAETALVELLADRYGLDGAQLTFVPHGIDSWSYVATPRRGRPVFVKLSRPGTSADAAGAGFPLLAALAAGLVDVPRPVADRDGRFSSSIGGYEAAVLEYLEGRTLEDETAWPDRLYGPVAQIAAAVHASTPVVRHLVDRAEDYSLPFLPDLLSTLALIEGGRLRNATALAGLREVVAPALPALRSAAERLEDLRDHARASESTQVLCHTDIWGSNLLLSAEGTVHLLDWGGARLGPPEQDLFIFAGTSFFPADRFAWFLDRYEAAFRPLRLDPAKLAFYLYRRNLEDLAGFVGSIAEDRTEMMDASAMLGIVARLVVETSRIEAQLPSICQVIDRRAAAIPPARARSRRT